jgi:hypothetical protein
MRGFLPPPPADASLTERFGWLLKALAFRVHWLGMREAARLSVVEVVAARLRRTVDRFTALLARFEAGTLTPPKPRPARRRPEPADPTDPDPDPQPPQPDGVRLPRDWGWLWKMSGDIEIYRLGESLHALVSNDAKMRALIEASPRLGRLLRPILWMTGARQLPPILMPPHPDPLMRRWAAGDAGKQVPTPPPAPPPFFASLMPTPAQQEEEARRHANRPGGLFWDGKRMFYS